MENAIVSEEKDKPVFDEQTLAKLLEAAYVLQEHSHELRALEAELGLIRDQVPDDTPEPTKTSEPLLDLRPEPANTFEPWLDPQPEPTKTSKPLRDLPQLDLPQEEKATAEPAKAAPPLPPSENVDLAPLAQVAEIQHEIQFRQLNLNDTMAIVTTQLIDICRAAGAAIGMASGKTICYRAVAGIRTLKAGSSVSREKAFCFPSLRTGQVFRCPDVNSESLIDTQECRRRGIGSFIAVPIFQEVGIAGGLELYYSDPRAFTEQDVQTCQMMAGILTEALARAGKSTNSSTTPLALSREASENDDAGLRSPASVVCYRCGHELVGQEQFCGECGAARSENHGSGSMQSKVASLWHMHESGEDLASAGKDDFPLTHERIEATLDDPDLPAHVSEAPINMRALQKSVLSNVPETSQRLKLASESSIGLEEKEQGPEAALSAGPEPAASVDWTSALSAREFLEQFAQGNRRGALAKFWNERRGDIYLAVSIILVMCVIRWGLWSNHTVKATATPATPAATTQKPAAPEISTFERMLISLGLAEAPETPQEKGNPATAVWVDLRSGLYYCPGSDPYGKTPKGKFTSQRDAQLDQFQPAYRKACD